MLGSPLLPQYWTTVELAKVFEINEDRIRAWLGRKMLRAYKIHVQGSIRNFVDYNEVQRLLCKYPIKQTNVSYEQWEAANG